MIAVKPVLGIGIGPAYHEIEYEPDSVVTLSFRIVNEEQKEQSIRLYLDEDSIGLIELEAENVNLKEDEPETTVKYSFKMPDNLAPGEHIYEVMIFSDDSSDAGNPNSINMQTNIALKHKIKVSVPYPEKHLTAEMFIKKEANNRINFRIALYNTGTKDLSNIKGLIMIFDPGGNQILSIASNEIALESSDSSKLVVELKQELLLGSYIVKALVSYDGESLELEKNLDIGDPLIEILNLGVNSFKLGSIAKLDMILKNRWNRDISDIEPSMKYMMIEETGLLNTDPRKSICQQAQHQMSLSIGTQWICLPESILQKQISDISEELIRKSLISLLRLIRLL
ncbi:MAG: hypothetical protein KKF44_03715 [Nanoarchaeota archaeon]|nr:hypothetical protein [Nanoarchaeota archaeon]